MPATVSYGSISQRTAAWAATEMLEHVMPIEVLARFAETKDIPKNTADNALFRRPIPFAPATTPLTEGVTPPGHAMQYENVPVQLQQYGDWVEITDKVHDMVEDPVLKDAAQMSGEQAAETMEAILWGVIRAGTSVAFMNGVQRSDVNTPLTGGTGKTMLANSIRFLKSQRAKFVTKMLDASVKIATVPVAAAFIAFSHTDIEPDLQGLPNFTSVENYGAATQALPYEVGKAGNIRFVLSPLLAPFPDAGGAKGTMKSTSGVNADVYPVVIVSQKSYANVGLRGARAITPMVLNPGVPRGGDPLGQRGSVAWKSYYAALRLNEAWLLRLEVAATA